MLVTQQPTESHQPGRHVDEDVMTVEHRVRTRVSPIQPVTAARRGVGDIFVIKRASVKAGQPHARRHVSFAPVSKARHRGAIRNFWKRHSNGASNIYCRQSASGTARGWGLQARLGKGSRMFSLVWTSCRKKSRSACPRPGRAQGLGVCAGWGAFPKLRRKPPLMQVGQGMYM